MNAVPALLFVAAVVLLVLALAGCTPLPPCEQWRFEVPGSEAWHAERAACAAERLTETLLDEKGGATR